MADFPHATNSPAGPGLLCRRLGAWIVFAIFLSGVVFRIAEYAADRSLWLDEAALASDILHQPLADLAAGRLHDSQVAPPGFALAVRLVTAIGGDSEPMLRLVSFVAGLATLTIITLLAWHRLNPVGAAATVALTAWSWPLIYYTNECKQYSTDALWAVLLFALAGKILGQSLTTRRAIAVGLAGCAALVFSQPALFGLAALGLSGITSAAKSKQRGEMVRWAVLGAVWLMLFALQMALSFNSTLGNKVLFTYHQNTFLTLWPLEDARQGLHDVLLGDWVSATAGTWQIWLGLLALGLWAGRQKHRQETVFIMLTLSGVAAASLLHVYPLAVRLVLFLFPLLFWLVGQGAAESAGWARGRAAWFVVPLLIWAAWPMGRDGVAVVRRPVAPEHLRPVAATLAEKVRPGDVVVVFDLTRVAFAYYWPRFAHAEVPVQAVIFEHDEPMPAAEMAAKIAPFLEKNPARVWLVATHYDLGAAPENLRTLVAVIRQRYPGAADFVPPSGTAQGVVFYQPGAQPE